MKELHEYVYKKVLTRKDKDCLKMLFAKRTENSQKIDLFRLFLKAVILFSA